MIDSAGRKSLSFDSLQSVAVSESQEALREILEKLHEFGLTKNQAKVFAFLEMFGPRSSPDISKSIKIARTETYGILGDLMNMGIIIANFSHPTKYNAVSFDQAIRIVINNAQEHVNELAKKEGSLIKMWNKIPYSNDTKENKDDGFQMLQGTQRIFNKMRAMINETETECKILGTTQDISKFYYADFIELAGSMRKDLRMIVSSLQKLPSFVKAFEQSKIRLLPTAIDNQCFLIKDKSEVLIFLRNFNFPSNSMLALWTNADSIIQSMNSLFNYSWNNSVPVNFEKYLN